MDWVNGNYQRILFHSVRTASADRVRRMAAPRRHLALVCFLHQAWRDTLDQTVDMYGKLLDRNRKLVEARLDDMLKAQRQAVDRIVHRYHRLGAVLLDRGTLRIRSVDAGAGAATLGAHRGRPESPMGRGDTGYPAKHSVTRKRSSLGNPGVLKRSMSQLPSWFSVRNRSMRSPFDFLTAFNTL